MDLISLVARNFITIDTAMSPYKTVTVARQHSVPFREPPEMHRRRHSYGGDISPTKPEHRKKFSESFHGTTSLSDLKQISWSEYTARRSLVKFRDRRAASYRSHDEPGIPPSQLAVRVLCNQYEACRKTDTNISERITAVFYCWFFGWITDVYNSLTHGGADRSFFKWFLSCMLVTLGATLLVGLVTLAGHGMLLLLESLVLSSVTFIGFLAMVFLLTLGTVTILSYSVHHPQRLTKGSRRNGH